jgi:hypothetical protein
MVEFLSATTEESSVVQKGGALDMPVWHFKFQNCRVTQE